MSSSDGKHLRSEENFELTEFAEKDGNYSVTVGIAVCIWNPSSRKKHVWFKRQIQTNCVNSVWKTESRLYVDVACT